MSSVASLYNVPTNDAELETWSFVHQAHHRDILRQIQAVYGQQLSEYALDPMDPENLQVWLDQHQDMHQQMDAVLGIAGYNLDQVEWSDPGNRAGWLFLNAQEHVQAAAKLGIG